MSFAQRLNGWLSRRTARFQFNSIDPQQREELARDIGIPQDVVARLILRGDRNDDELKRLRDALSLNPSTISSAVARDMSVVCLECRAIRRCRRELDRGSAHMNYQSYCPNAPTFDELRQEPWRSAEIRH